MLIAVYFTVVVWWVECPVLIGPYENVSACASVRERLDRRGYETGACGYMSAMQEAELLDVGYLPR